MIRKTFIVYAAEKAPPGNNPITFRRDADGDLFIEQDSDRIVAHSSVFTEIIETLLELRDGE